MAYMVIHCESCGGSWQVYDRDDLTHWHAHTCPHCGKRIDRATWEAQVIPAFGAVADANRELFKDATGYHGPQFSFDVFGDTFFTRRPALDEAETALLQDVSDGLHTLLEGMEA